ncbi:MAG: HNH endonuclease family protein [Thermodesulfobacteriota bacterium]
MKIQLEEITVSELVNGYKDNEESGVLGYGGKLDIRPPYQREFIYKGNQRDAVIDTLTKDFPLNVMYWAVREDGNFEVIDGQQRTISIAQYVEGDFSFRKRYFHNLQDNEQEQILNYKLTVYLCSGTDSEKLEWFKTINIAGEKLTDQELRNAVYSGSWVTDAKRYFSRNGCPAYGLGSNYLSGVAIRQEYLETAIKWVTPDTIEEYMAQRQHETEAEELWTYFQAVIAWIKEVFTEYRKEMKAVDWGFLYTNFKDKRLNAKKLDKEIVKLMEDEEVGNKKGVYVYVLTREEKHLNLRAFTDKQKRETYERQKGICPLCKGKNKKKKWKFEEMEGDHITPWSEGGKTDSDNCQMLCKEDNRKKSNR